MSLDAVKLDQCRIVTNSGKVLTQLALLVNRKQDVGLYADNQRPLELQSFKRGI